MFQACGDRGPALKGLVQVDDIEALVIARPIALLDDVVDNSFVNDARDFFHFLRWTVFFIAGFAVKSIGGVRIEQQPAVWVQVFGDSRETRSHIADREQAVDRAVWDQDAIELAAECEAPHVSLHEFGTPRAQAAQATQGEPEQAAIQIQPYELAFFAAERLEHATVATSEFEDRRSTATLFPIEREISRVAQMELRVELRGIRIFHP